LPLKSAHLAVLVHMLLRKDQRAAWSVLQDHPPLPIQRLANPVELGLTTLMPVQLASSAVMAHSIITLDRWSAKIALSEQHRSAVTLPAECVQWGLTPPDLAQHANLALQGHFHQNQCRCHALNVQQEHRLQ
jgi:hypothetical protein